MSAENVAAMNKILAMFGSGDFTGVESLIDANTVDHQAVPGIDTDGLEGFKRIVTTMRTAFPDMRIRIDDVLDSGDKVASRSTMMGTHTGPFMDIPPTGKTIEIESIDIVRFAGGKAVEHWGVTEEMKMMQQLGLAPQP